MMLGDPALAQAATAQSGITLDGLFRRVAARRPGARALADAPNRQSFTDGAPLTLTYAEADRMISAIAGRLRRMGLATDSVVGIQMPNIVEHVLTFFGVIRAGLIPAPLPLLWRRADAVTALARVGAKALVTTVRAGGFAHCDMALHVAAEVFSIRYVCGFGAGLPDGAVALDDVLVDAAPDPAPALDRGGNAAGHLAAVTFEVGEDGPVPVARRHLEFLAGGLGVHLESGFEPEANLLTSLAPSSFAGICLSLMPWLFAGGTLVLHHPFDDEVLARQRHSHRCRLLVLPAPVAYRLAETGLFHREGPTTVLAVWHAPERFCTSADWPERDAVMVDAAIFGEAGLIAARRGAGGRAVALPLGEVFAPRDANERGRVSVAETAVSARGTLLLRGPMAPRHAFPPGIERSDQPHFEIGHDGFVDTGYPCTVDALSKTLAVAGPPPGIVNVGGYRFPLCALLETIGRIDRSAALAALPDPLMGQCLAGTAADLGAMQAALAALGVNPLVTAAFAERGEALLNTVIAGRA